MEQISGIKYEGLIIEDRHNMWLIHPENVFHRGLSMHKGHGALMIGSQLSYEHPETRRNFAVLNKYLAEIGVDIPQPDSKFDLLQQLITDATAGRPQLMNIATNSLVLASGRSFTYNKYQDVFVKIGCVEDSHELPDNDTVVRLADCDKVMYRHFSLDSERVNAIFRGDREPYIYRSESFFYGLETDDYYQIKREIARLYFSDLNKKKSQKKH